MHSRTLGRSRAAQPLTPCVRSPFTAAIALLARDTCRSSWAAASRAHRSPPVGVAEDAIRRCLLDGGVIERVPVAARDRGVVLYDLTALGRKVCSLEGIPTAERPARTIDRRG